MVAAWPPDPSLRGLLRLHLRSRTVRLLCNCRGAIVRTGELCFNIVALNRRARGL